MCVIMSMILCVIMGVNMIVYMGVNMIVYVCEYGYEYDTFMTIMMNILH